MKIKRSTLTAIIKEELAKHVKSLIEAEAGGSVVDAEDDAQAKDKKKSKGKKEVPGNEPEKAPEEEDDVEGDDAEARAAKTDVPFKNDGGEAGDEPPDVDPGDEPASDDELEKDVAGEDDPDEVTGSGVAQQIVGKTVQSMTMEPESKVLPGAQEIEITFRDSPDPLKILITQTGIVKLFYANALHNAT